MQLLQIAILVAAQFFAMHLPAREATSTREGVQAIDTSKWKTYRNEKYGFEIKYPETWVVRGSSGTGPEITSIRGPMQGGGTAAGLTAAIQSNQNPAKLSIQDWFDAQLKKMNARPEATGPVTIGGQAAV